MRRGLLKTSYGNFCLERSNFQKSCSVLKITLIYYAIRQLNLTECLFSSHNYLMNPFLDSLYPIIIKFTISKKLWFLCITVYILKLRLEMWSKNWDLNLMGHRNITTVKENFNYLIIYYMHNITFRDMTITWEDVMKTEVKTSFALVWMQTDYMLLDANWLHAVEELENTTCQNLPSTL